MKRKPNVYLHIGTRKTGSSALQQFFFDNNEVFLKHGINYPLPPENVPTANHHALAQHLSHRTDTKTAAVRADYADNVRSIIERNPDATTVISSEHFYAASDPSMVFDYFSDMNVVIVLYIRRIDNYLQSCYSQDVKSSWVNGNIHEYIEQYNVKTYSAIEEYTSLFGIKNIIIRPYEKNQLYKQDICHDFLNASGVGNACGIEAISFNPNPPTRWPTIELLRLMNQHGDSISELGRIKADIRRIISRNESFGLFNDHNYISPGERRTLISRYAKYDRQIAIDYLGRASGDLFMETIPSADQDWVPDRSISSAEIVRCFVELCEEYLAVIENRK